MTSSEEPIDDEGSRPGLPRGVVPAPERYPGPALRLAADYAWRLLVVGAAAYVTLRILGHLLTVVVPLVLSLLVTAALRPLLAGLVRRGVPRGLATLVSMLVAVVVIGGIGTLVVTKAVQQAPQLGQQIDQLIPKIEHWLVTGPFRLDRGAISHFSSTLTKEVGKNSAAIASTAVSTGRAVLDVLTGLVLGIFITVFLLYDGERIWRFVLAGFPRRGRDRADLAGRSAWETLTHYVRGTLVVAVFHGIVMAVTLEVLGVPLVMPLALIVAIGSFVPLLGTVVTGVLAVSIAGLVQGLVAAVVVAIVLVIDNQVDAHLLQPFVVGRYVHIHPLGVVLSLAVGTILLGVFGAIIAVPAAACLAAVVRSLLATRRPAGGAAVVEDGGADGDP